MTATLPTNWTPAHAPTAAELAQVLDAVKALSNVEGIANAQGSSTTTSSSYANVPGTSSFSFTKHFSSSRLLVTMTLGFRSATTIPGACDGGVLINGTDYDVCHLEANASVNAHETMTGEVLISSIPAGTYTVQGRWKRSGGTGTITSDGNDRIVLVVREIPA